MSLSAANPLAEYRWNYRIILYAVPEAERKAWEEHLNSHKAEILERDLRLVDLNRAGKAPLHLDLDPTTLATLRKRYAVKEKETVLLLLGKDGGLKMTQRNAFRLEPLFKEIDQMPMRQEEMRNR